MADLSFSAFGDDPAAAEAALASAGPNDVVLCGWVDPTSESDTAAVHSVIKGQSPAFAAPPPVRDGNTAFLWDAARAANGGQHFRVFYQQTGSCVGNGGGQAVWYLSAVEVVRLRDPEQVLLPFYLLPYGKSREIGGLRGRGEGSFGSAFAKAIKQEGILPADTAGLPKPTDQGGLTWGRAAELEWSDGARIAAKWLDQSRKHVVRTAANVRSADEVRDAVRGYYPVTIASDWGGRTQCPVTDGVLLNERVTTWMHQMCVVGWQDHPRLGELFFVLNSWGASIHGTDPAGGPAGGFWVRRKDMDYIARQGDSWAFSQFDGFPGQELDFSAF